jgi:ABC-2 type transport system permease protein
MITIIKKELSVFFGSLIGYFIIGIFLVITGLFMWVFSDTSLLNYPYATLDQLFTIGPLVFMFIIPALTMRSFAEEHQQGTMELLYSKPISLIKIIGGKFLACAIVVLFSILPTLLYVYTLQSLTIADDGLDMGAIQGSYLGLFMCGFAFCAIGLFASSLVKNQIIAFLVGALLCFIFYLGLDYFSGLPIFVGYIDLILQKSGINYHYLALNKGVIEFRSIFYFLSFVLIFLTLTHRSLILNRG